MFKVCNQFWLIPQNYKEYLWEWHEAIILEEIINELNLTEIINSYSNQSRWTTAYNPRMLLKILFYGYMNQTFSSRKIARKLRSDLAFMYLSWNNKPDFRTINGFRKNKWEMLEWIFVQIVLKAQELWLITIWTVNLDGTKIYANASKYKNNDIEKLEKKIENMFKEAEKIDRMEDEEYWDKEDEIPEELKTKEWREKKRKEIEEKKKKLEEKKELVKKEIEKKKKEWIEQTKINETDKDSRLMKMKRKDWWNWYNPQNITENQFVISTRVPNTANDTQELIPSLEKMQKQYWILPKNIGADAGYWTEESYKYAEKNNIKTYIPHVKINQNRENFIYNKEEDNYKDKEWNIYKFESYVYKEKWWKKVEWNEVKAKKYVRKLSNGRKRTIKIYEEYNRLCKNNDQRLYSEEWRKIYKRRWACVEPVFWNIKYNLWFERFLLRWFKWVWIEWNLITLAHNLQKMIKFKIS